MKIPTYASVIGNADFPVRIEAHSSAASAFYKSDPVTISLLGQPVAYAKSKFLPKKQRNTTAELRLKAEEAMEGREMIDQPIRLNLQAELSIPRSWSSIKQHKAAAGQIRPTVSPDLTNVIKLAEDAFKGVVWRDDSLIVEQHCRKIYSMQPKIVITVTPL